MHFLVYWLFIWLKFGFVRHFSTLPPSSTVHLQMEATCLRNTWMWKIIMMRNLNNRKDAGNSTLLKKTKNNPHVCVRNLPSFPPNGRFDTMYASAHIQCILITAVQVVAGVVEIKWRVKATVGFITSMFTVWCRCEGEMWDAGTAAEQCSRFIVRSCDPFHGAEYWADWLTSNTPARCRLLTALIARQEGRGGGCVRECVCRAPQY